MKGIKGFQPGHHHSEETKKKIGLALSKKVIFNCDYCGNECFDKPSSYARKRRHFCHKDCYASFRRECMPKEEQQRFGSGLPQAERDRRAKCRNVTNKAIISGKLIRMPCEICGDNKSEAHHDDYYKPLEVRWLCFIHHRAWHKENPELLDSVKENRAGE